MFIILRQISSKLFENVQCENTYMTSKNADQNIQAIYYLLLSKLSNPFTIMTLPKRGSCILPCLAAFDVEVDPGSVRHANQG